VFLEGVFRRIERWIEGPAAARAKLDQASFAGKFVRRGTKMVVFFAIAAVIAHSFVGYFMPTEILVEAVTSSPGKHPTAFVFVLVATLAMFVNFTWFREQTCIVICPYGRLQGALYDPDTILVGYDRTRGEPRGKHRRPDGQGQPPELGGGAVLRRRLRDHRSRGVIPRGPLARRGARHDRQRLGVDGGVACARHHSLGARRRGQ
jgi:hypothetical protein